VRVVPENEIGEETDGTEFPPKVEVPKSFVREHERLELEADHLREQLREYKQYANRLQEQVEDREDVEEVVHLEDLDDELDTDETYRIG
jgi:regulator of replication initiation timing